MKMQNAVTKSGYEADQVESNLSARHSEAATLTFDFYPKDHIALTAAKLTKKQSFSRFIEAVYARR